jgi:hypothetical protein
MFHLSAIFNFDIYLQVRVYPAEYLHPNGHSGKYPIPLNQATSCRLRSCRDGRQAGVIPFVNIFFKAFSDDPACFCVV